jgi:ATP-dependent DNA ligase
MINIKKFPRLYGDTSTGKKKYWDIYVKRDTLSEGYNVVIEYGMIGTNKPVVAIKTITEGKNIGKINETSCYEQAVFEAESKWKKKKSEGMDEMDNIDISKLSIKENDESSKTDTNTNTTESKKIFPMLALNFTQRSHDINFPCYVQAKLDGVRCIITNGKMTSRQAKEFKHLEHIKSELKDCPYILDGELYSDTLTFQEATGLIRKTKVTESDIEKSKQIKFVVYDIIKPEDYTERLEILKKYFEGKDFKYTELLKTENCESKEQVKLFHKKYISQGYEGVIIRNKTGHYQESYRSKNLQKYKEFIDDEYKIVGFTDGTGIEKGLIIWTCETKSGSQFQVRPKGTHDERRELYKKGNLFKGKYLTVVYQELTDDGIPRFPTTRNGGIGDIRDYE